MHQGDLAPIVQAGLPDLGQILRQFVHDRHELFTSEIKTDAFGPYTPAKVPIWVLKMMRRDFAIALGLKALKGPLLKSSRYRLEGGDPRARAFTEKWLRPLLPKLLRTTLNAIDFGFQAHEIVYHEDLPTIRFKVGKTETQIRRAVIPRKFVDIDPERVEILVRPEDMRFEGLEVFEGPTTDSRMISLQRNGKGRYIAPSKVFLSSYEPEFGNLRGKSGLNAAYNPWWWKNVGYLYWGRFMERLGIGVYVGTAPADIRTDTKGTRQSPVDLMQAILLNLRAAGVVTVPFEPDAVTQENKFKVELLETKNDGSAFEKWINHLSVCALRGILVPDRLVLQDGTGSFAAQEVTFNQFFSWLESILDETVLEPINSQVIAPVTEWNFDEKTEPARLKATPLDPATKKILTEILKSVLPTLRSKGEDGKQISNSALPDAAKMIESLDVPLRPEEEWPETDVAEMAALAKPSSKENDITNTDTDKNGDKKPTDERR